MLIAIFIPIIALFSSIHADVYTVYAHGIVDKPSQITRFADAIVTDQDHTKTVKFQDCNKETGYGINRIISEITTQLRKPVNRSKMHMGQGPDIATIHHEVQHIAHTEQIILYGCSRGGAAILSYLGQYNPSNIAAVVLDASPANMPTTIHPLLAKAGIHKSYDTSIFSTLFPCYPTNTSTPLQNIKNIKNKHIPILIIHSENDKNVPFSHALQIYTECMKQGLRNVYLVRIPQGRHSFLLQDAAVKHPYLTAVHSFYKKNHLPYNKEYAQDNMAQYQPDMTKIQTEITNFENSLQEQYESSKTRNYITASISAAIMIAYLYYKNYLKKN